MRRWTVFRRIMNIEDYRAILRAVDQALKICEQPVGFADEIQGEICEDLRETRATVLRLIGATKPETA